MAIEVSQKCGMRGSAKLGKDGCTIEMVLTCRRKLRGSCPRAEDFPIARTRIMAFPPTDETTFRTLNGNIQAEIVKCTDS